MKSLKHFVLLFIFIMQLAAICSIDIEHENTWTKHTRYKSGSEILDEMLFVNAHCSVECYNIYPNGQIELVNVLEVSGLIHSMDLDESDQMLYLLIGNYNVNDCYWIDAYQIIDNELEFCFTTGDIGMVFNENDLIYPVSEYVILDQTDFPCYNKQTQELEYITFPYQVMIGCFDDKLIEYKTSNTTINFYQIEDINNPTLLYQYDYTMNSYNGSYVRNFDGTNCLLIDDEQILIFNVSDEQNYAYESTWEFTFLNGTGGLFEPIPIQNDQLYIGTEEGENFVFDITDYNDPTVLYNWVGYDSDLNSYCLYDDNVLYKNEDGDGIWLYLLSDLPSTQFVMRGEVFPMQSTAYIEGMIYKNEINSLYEVNPETLEEEYICEIPFNTSWAFYKFENMLIIENGVIYSQDCLIIDLDSNQMMNQISITGSLGIIQNGKIFIQNEGNLGVYEINEDYELEYLLNLDVDSNYMITELDDDTIWISCTDRDFIFNSITLEIEHDFSDFFSPNSPKFAVPYIYENKLIINDYTPNIRLYDISDLDNPVLLDTKSESHYCFYAELDDYILEYYRMEPVRIYDKFDDLFTDPIQIYDFNTLIFDLQIDEEQNRIIASSWYFFKSFIYEPTGFGIEIIPEYNYNLSNYPNPFNPETYICFTLSKPEEVVLEIFNTKGQKVRELVRDQFQAGQHSIIWNGKDDLGKQTASGIYFYKMKAGKFVSTKKMILMK
jgi:FlgD Ig-like domain